MDILKRRIAPISELAWQEIEETAVNVIKSILSARMGLRLNGPKGWDYNAVPEGRLEMIEENKNGVSTGSYRLQKLVEARRSFVLNKWELDNIERGAKDIDLDALEEAAEELALFEENLIFNGYKPAGIVGLSEAAEHQMTLGKDPNTILKNIGNARYALFNSYVLPPYDLFVSPEAYDRLNVIYEGSHLLKLVARIIEGDIIRSKVVKGAVMIPHKDEDLELTVGQDFSVGYEKDDTETVTLFVTESLAFRVLNEAKIVNFKL